MWGLLWILDQTKSEKKTKKIKTSNAGIGFENKIFSSSCSDEVAFKEIASCFSDLEAFVWDFESALFEIHIHTKKKIMRSEKHRLKECIFPCLFWEHNKTMRA